MKEFNLKHALKTLEAKDDKGNIWILQGFDPSNSRLQWRKTLVSFRCYGETDIDGKAMFGECSDLFSAEVEKTTQTFYAGKIDVREALYTFTYSRPSDSHNIVYEINLNLEDGEIKSINFEKVRGE